MESQQEHSAGGRLSLTAAAVAVATGRRDEASIQDLIQLGRLRHDRVKVARDEEKFLEWAINVLTVHAHKKSVLEVRIRYWVNLTQITLFHVRALVCLKAFIGYFDLLKFFNESHELCFKVEFIGEEGTGLGPTLEFYALVSAELQKKSLAIWMMDDNFIEEQQREVGAYVNSHTFL